MKHAQQGFTLIEMLIVIAIIGVLASLVLVGLGPVQRQGRDARRIQDLRQVQTGLELYFIKNGAYPATQGGASLTDWASLTSALLGANVGISNVPKDPTSSQSYQYASDGASYVLKATLEDSSNARLDEDMDGVILGVDCSDPSYCIQL